MTNTNQDALYMIRALQLARKGLYTTDPNPRVGCVLVKDGRVIGEGWHKRAGQAHAEIEALNDSTENPAGAAAYVTLEPCSHHGKTPPCCEALVKAGIKRVVAAILDPNPLVSGKGLAFLQANGIEVTCGVLEQDARELNKGFIKRMAEGRPFVRSKLAMSLDGRTAMASGESKWITSEESRADVQKLRAQSSAILTGINTVLADDPSLTARVEQEVVQPIRVVLDSRLQMPPTAKMLGLPGRTIILTCEYSQFKKYEDKTPPALRQGSPECFRRTLGESNQNKTVRAEPVLSAAEGLVEVRTTKYNLLVETGFEVYELPANSGRIDLNAVMTFLAQQHINEVLVEAGAILNGALLTSNLVDEWIIYMAPKILGDQGREAFNLPGLDRLADCKTTQFEKVIHVGQDLKYWITKISR